MAERPHTSRSALLVGLCMALQPDAVRRKIIPPVPTANTFVALEPQTPVKDSSVGIFTSCQPAPVDSRMMPAWPTTIARGDVASAQTPSMEASVIPSRSMLQHRDAGAVAVTDTTDWARMPPASPKIVAVPLAMARASPEADTETTRVSDEDHVTVLGTGCPAESLRIACSCNVEPAMRNALAGTTSSVFNGPSTGPLGSSSQATASRTQKSAREVFRACDTVRTIRSSRGRPAS